MENTAIEAVRTRLTAVPRLIAPTINGSVPIIQKYYSAIVGFKRSQAFFRKETRGIDGARTKMQHHGLIYISATFGSPKRRAMFDSYHRSLSRCVALLTASNTTGQPSRLWDKADKLPPLLQAVNRSLGNFDMELAWVKLTHLQAEIEDLLADVEVMRDMGIEK